MSQNDPAIPADASPYAAPKAALADAPVPNLQRPVQVTRAVRCLWIGYVVSLVLMLWILGQPKMETLGPGSEMRAFASSVMLGFFVLVFAVSALLNVKIAAGRNWARIVYLVLNLFWIVSLPFALFSMKAGTTSLLEGAGNLFNFAISMFTCYLLLTRESREWYRAKSA